MNSSKDYNQKIQQEIEFYKNKNVVHDLPDIFHYWSNKYIVPKFKNLGFSNPDDFFIQYIKKICNLNGDKLCRILSIGSGNCDTEVKLANLLIELGIMNFSISCLDINPHMLEKGKELVKESEITSKFNFLQTDINNWKIEEKYHIIIAYQSLHHFVELEILFDKIYEALYPEGFFLTNDMIGRNGHMRWPEALELVHALWYLIEDRHKYNHQLKRFESKFENWDCSKEGFEGVRSQDILPLLIKKFKFDLFIGFGNIIFVFVDRSFGPNYDPKNQWDITFIDFVAKLDEYYIMSGKIKPNQMLAAMTKDQKGPTKIYKHLSPEFCVRMPDEIKLTNRINKQKSILQYIYQRIKDFR